MSVYKIKVEAYKLLYGFYYRKPAVKNVDKNILISGVPRGGTTWLMEMMHDLSMQVIWEPLKFETLSKVKGIQFASELGVIPFIPEKESWDEAYEYFYNLFKGDVEEQVGMDSHPLLLSNPFHKTRLIIKLCNANLLLPWLCKNFNIQPLVIVRSPFAVIASQLNHPGFKDIGIKHNLFSLNKPKYMEVFQKYEQQIAAIDSQVSMLANWWAIQHADMLNYGEEGKKYHVVFYEDLVRETSYYLNHFYKLYHIDKEINLDKMYQPSATSRLFTGNAKDYLSILPQSLSSEQLKVINDVVLSYGITQYAM